MVIVSNLLMGFGVMFFILFIFVVISSIRNRK